VAVARHALNGPFTTLTVVLTVAKDTLATPPAAMRAGVVAEPGVGAGLVTETRCNPFLAASVSREVLKGALDA